MGLIELLIVILILGWLFGFVVGGIGEIIHLLIVVAIFFFIFRFRLFNTGFYGRRSGGPRTGL